jgi:hypothetical protein
MKADTNFLYRFILVLTVIFISNNAIAQKSTLADGQLFKIGITKTGVYKLDAALLKNIGLNINNLNPKNIQIFGNGGAMLVQSNAVSRASDLVENAILVKGEADVRFDDNDAVWFYGQSPHQVQYNVNGFFEHQTNMYSDTTFYFLKIGTTNGLRIQNQKSGNSGLTINTFDDYIFRESELTNKVQSGREWWGEYFGTQTQLNINFETVGLVPNSTFRLTAATVAAAQVTTKFGFSVNGQLVGTQSMGIVSTYRYDYKGQRAVQSYLGSLSTNDKIQIGIAFDKNGQQSAEGYLDFVGIQTQRYLRLYEQPTVFQSISSTKQDSVQYVIGQANNNLLIWDITNAQLPSNQLYKFSGNSATFGAAGKTLKKYMAFTETQLQNPVSVVAVSNQNLRQIPVPELLIIAADKWQKQAQRLADFRQTNDGLSAQVVTIKQVFNEFSSGRLDPTAIRDFAKYLYERQPSRLKYLLLMGDATFDYKNNGQSQSVAQRANFIPTYQSRESASPVYSYSSDDYFGFLKPTDGDWPEDYSSSQFLDIGVGRLPVKSLEEAEVVVNKLIKYSSKTTKGRWQQRICFVADDGDGNIHQQDAEYLSRIIDKNAPQFSVKKLFIDAFPQNSNASGQRAPEVNQAITKAATDGVLIMNYTGHGGQSGWAEEQILTIGGLLDWRNLDNLPLLVTATCEFGRCDDPNVVSGAELAVLSPRGGAIALLTTTRPVFANTNFLLNQAFYQTVFKPINGQMPRLGDVFRITKNNSVSGVLNRNFMLMGDPSLRLNYPAQQIEISTTNDTLKAGKLVTISGQVKTNNKLSINFNGTVNITVYDKENQLLTRGTESPQMIYNQFNSKIFEGKSIVKNGQFSIQFVVPKNIDYRIGKGRIESYAIQTDSLFDAIGSNDVLVGGTDILANDNKPPIIEMYLNDKSFVNGQEVDESSIFVANLSDENGLNVSRNGVGNDMVLTLNDTLSLTVTDYFSAQTDNYRAGRIQYPFKKLSAGDYKLKLKVWDTYNNSTESSLEFRVLKRETFIKKIVAFPNPFSDVISLQLDQFESKNDIEADIIITDLNGKILKSTHVTGYDTDEKWTVYQWDGTNESGADVGNGIYLFQINATTQNSFKSQKITGKLALKR